jgi:SpoIID/LytB domain protein
VGTEVRGRLRRAAGAALLGVGVLGAVTVPSATPAHAEVTGDVQFSGHGWGHGRGMGQYGAYGYATNAGWSYSQILAHYYGGTTEAQQANAPITVSLGSQTGKDLVVTSGRDFTAGGVPVSAGSAARITARPDGSFVLSTSYGCASPITWTVPVPNSRVVSTVANPGNDLTSMLSLCTAGGTTQYRGELSVVSASGVQQTVNTVLMEDYLRGVVPRESPASWGDGGGGKGIEALKAQAVAARSYAWAEGRSGYAKTCDSTSCQVYMGAGANNKALEDRRTDTAVAATANVVLRTGAGGVVRTEFSSSTGGYSAGGTFPAVVDDGDTVSPYHDWSQLVPATTIASAFGVGTLTSITVTGRNGLGADGGRVTQVQIAGTAKTAVATGVQVRAALGLRSDWFVIGGAVTGPTVPAGPAQPTVYQGSANVARPTAVATAFGEKGDVPLSCDWNGDGVDTLGVFRAGTFYLTNRSGGGAADQVFGFGQAGDQPVCGDWDGDGKDTVGLFRQGVVYLRNSLTTGVADGQFFFGGPTDRLVTGDWNGDGFDTVGVWRTGAYFLTQSNIRPTTDLSIAYGAPDDEPAVGDWDRNGTDTIGVFRNGGFFLRNSNTSGSADLGVPFGDRGDKPLVGRWSAGAADVVGVSRSY